MIWTGLTKYSNTGLLIIRLGLGAAFMMHGLGKFQGGEKVLTMVGSAMGNLGLTGGFYAFGVLAASSELLGGLLVLLGAFFRPACLMILSVLSMALLMHLKHGDSFNVFSHAAELLVVFLGLFLVGPGTLSVDRK